MITSSGHAHEYVIGNGRRMASSNSHSYAIADHMTQTDHRFKLDHFDILVTGQSDIHCKIKETLLIRDLKPALNENVGNKKLLLY